MSVVRLRSLRLWWMRQHTRGRCWLWCQDCRWAQEALAAGECYYHDEPSWHLDEVRRRPVEIVAAPPIGPNIVIGPPGWKPRPAGLTYAVGRAKIWYA